MSECFSSDYLTNRSWNCKPGWETLWSNINDFAFVTLLVYHLSYVNEGVSQQSLTRKNMQTVYCHCCTSWEASRWFLLKSCTTFSLQSWIQTHVLDQKCQTGMGVWLLDVKLEMQIKSCLFPWVICSVKKKKCMCLYVWDCFHTLRSFIDWFLHITHTGSVLLDSCEEFLTVYIVKTSPRDLFQHHQAHKEENTIYTAERYKSLIFSYDVAPVSLHPWGKPSFLWASRGAVAVEANCWIPQPLDSWILRGGGRGASSDHYCFGESQWVGASVVEEAHIQMFIFKPPLLLFTLCLPAFVIAHQCLLHSHQTHTHTHTSLYFCRTHLPHVLHTLLWTHTFPSGFHSRDVRVHPPPHCCLMWHDDVTIKTKMASAPSAVEASLSSRIIWHWLGLTGARRTAE